MLLHPELRFSYSTSLSALALSGDIFSLHISSTTIGGLGEFGWVTAHKRSRQA
jgi:hypothetical protein